MKFILAIVAALALAAPAHAQKAYTQAELDALLAPVALQTDGVLTQVLMAATYPEDVAAAAAWSRANPQLRGDPAIRAVEQEPWDPSVKSLLAFPELLARMDESPQWLHDLGEAFLTQQAQVMDTVQGLRRRAQAHGQLVTTNDTAVYHQGEAIVVQPRAEVVYVRYYDPYVVYGPWWWGPYYRPVAWRPWHPYPVVVVRGFFYSAPDWHHRHVRVIHRPVYVHRHYHVTPGHWQHRASVHRVQEPRRVHDSRHSQQHRAVTQPHVRVPESQRKPIVQQQQPQQQQMPAANGYSNQHRNTVRHPEPRREHRVEPRREHHSEPRREHGDHRSEGHQNRGGREHRGHRG